MAYNLLGSASSKPCLTFIETKPCWSW